MNYSQTIEYLFTTLPSFQEVGSSAYKPGLERITTLCKILSNPQRNFFAIHVAGTNGKGSTSHILASVLQEAGYCVGLYTSPHLVDFRERIRIDGQKISKQSVVSFVDKHRDKMEALSLSFFEMTTVMAFDYFAQNNVEVAIIETGLGGRLDATNIITPRLSIITNISLEHQQYLGETVAEIAAEKGGIIKKSIPLVVGEHNAQYDGLFIARTEELNSSIIFAQDEFRCLGAEASAAGQTFTLERNSDKKIFSLEIDLEGAYQRQNIITAVAALNYLHLHSPLSISRRALVNGVKNTARSTALKGRWQRLSSAPLTVCDTAHNTDGIKEVCKQIEACQYKKLYCVIGFAADKKLDQILALLPTKAYYIFTQPNNQRALDSHTLLTEAKRHNLKGECIPTVREAVAKAHKLASTEDMIFIGGSNFVVAELDI